jgi:anti-sigma-K factor RskA
VFSRRLYTAQGQQAFEEIRRRYQSDGAFRETVDRYIQEFERLLTEVSRDDPDSPVAKSYLTSETGKVYTMLAHAADRFE